LNIIYDNFAEIYTCNFVYLEGKGLFFGC
jgi:hypothetical protein